MNLQPISLLVIVVLTCSFSMAQNPIGKKLSWEFEPSNYSITKNTISITTGPHTNIFKSPDGKFISNNAPRLLFEADKQFSLSARVNVDFIKKWDSGVLFIDTGEGHWAKICFEKDYRGINRIVTVVNRNFSDDCNSDVIPGNEVYLKAYRDHDVYRFYYSTDGVSWYMTRAFNLEAKNDSIRVGFMAQSPVGEGCLVLFEEIKYNNEALTDIWNGK